MNSDSSTTLHLWFIRETDKARLYSKLPPERNPIEGDFVWIPMSIIEHVSKHGDEHDVKLPEWFIQARGL
jgi:hypothetical protein